jgi:hypothetical protein
MKYLSLGLLVLVSAATIAAQTPASKPDDKVSKDPITLTGCVEAGAAANTFILTHVVKGDSSAKTSSATPQPSVDNPTATPPIAPPTPTATSGTDADAKAATYLLDPPDKLKAHLGHKVSVSGTLDDDSGKAKESTPAAADAQAPKTGDKEPSKLNVKTVTMISASCS